MALEISPKYLSGVGAMEESTLLGRVRTGRDCYA